MDTHQKIAQHLGKTRNNPLNGVEYNPNILRAVQSLSPLITSTALTKDFTGSTAVGGKRGIGYRHANLVIERPVPYIPFSERKQLAKDYKADWQRLGLKGKFSTETYLNAGGKFPRARTIEQSKDFDIYEAILKALGKPLGTYIDYDVWNATKNAMKSPGFNKSELDAVNAKLGLRGDSRLEYNTDENYTFHPEGRWFNVSYLNQLKGSALIGLGIIPSSSRNMNQVLEELGAKSEVSFEGKKPTQTRAKSIEERRAELSTSTSTNTNVIEEAPISDDSGSTDAASGEGEVTKGEGSDGSSEKKSKKGWIIGGIAAVVVLGGVGYYLMSEQ